MLSRQDALAIKHAQETQLETCAELEAFADRLRPGMRPSIAPELAISLDKSAAAATLSSSLLLDAVKRVNRLRPATTSLRPMARRLQRQAEEDVQLADELREVLTEFQVGHKPVSSDALGYMLRGYFASVRRRIAVERTILSAIDAPIAA